MKISSAGWLIWCFILSFSSTTALAQLNEDAKEPPTEGDDTKLDRCSKSGEEYIEGELQQMYVDDFGNKNGYSIYEIHTADKCVYKIHPKKKEHKDKLKKFRSGTKIKIKGTLKNHDIDLSYAVQDLGSDISATEEPTVDASGDESTIVILANFSTKSLSCSQSQVNKLMFNSTDSVASYYKNASYQSVSFSGDTVGPFNIAADGSTCDYNTWASQAASAAIANGIDLARYRHRVYVVPQSVCGWAGLGSIGGNPSHAWIIPCDAPSVYAHELGHNLGMHHAATPTSEYGDTSDVMGCCSYNLPNAPHKFQQGWIPSNNVVDASRSGTFSVSILDKNPQEAASPQIIKIAKPDTNDFYYLSYRANSSWPGTLTNSYLGGTNVHTFAGGVQRTYFLKTLKDGELFTDTVNSFSVTQVAHDNNSVTLQINLACATHPPQAAITPMLVYQKSGLTTDYKVSVTNQDAGGCGESTFAIECLSPDLGLSYSEVANIPYGQTSTKIFSVHSALGKASAPYPINCTISRDATEGEIPLNASYVVDDIKPQTPTLSGTSAKRGTISLTWNGSSDNNAVVGYVVLRDGKIIASPVSTTYVDRVPAGTRHKYRVYAIDAAQNKSALSNTIERQAKR